MSAAELVRPSRRRRAIVAGSVLTGLVLVAVGSLLTKHGYASSLLLDLGVTSLLVVPIVWIESLLEQRVVAGERETRRQVGEVAEEVEAVNERLEGTRRRLEDLQAEMAQGLRTVSDADAELVEAARQDISLSRFADLFARARELDAIAANGLRVSAGGQRERLRFGPPTVRERPAGGQVRGIRISVETPGGTPEGIEAWWDEDARPTEAFLELAERWKRATTYPGDHAVDLVWIFERLLRSFDVAINGRRTRGDEQLDRLIELVTPTWALTEYGLEHLPEYYVIERSTLLDEDRLEQMRTHVGKKLWVVREDEARDDHDPDFWQVAEIAHEYWTMQGDVEDIDGE
jgi:hypothetical protein